MKPFNLEEALKGAPVKLRNGAKAYVFANIKDLFPSTEIECPLIGIHSHHGDYSYYSDNESWTLEGRYYPDSYDCDSNSFDIISMWEEPELTQEQILEKAYSENLKVTFDKAIFKTGYEVAAKTKDGEYILKSPAGLSLAKSYRGIKIYEEKPSTSAVTVTLPRPFKPEIGDNFYYIYSELYSGILKVASRKFDQDDSNAATQDGNRFSTFDDAKAWINAMNGALDE